MLKGGLKTTHLRKMITRYLHDLDVPEKHWKNPNIHNQLFQNSGKVKKLIAANQTLRQNKF